jgi:hypothetical protein
MNTVLAIAKSSRLVAPLTHGLDGRELVFSYGREIPKLDPENCSYWMGGAFAYQLQFVGHATELCSPGSNWLPSLDENVTGRKVHTGTLKDIAGGTDRLFVKPAEAKISSLPASAYTGKEVEAVFAAEGFADGIQLQWTEGILKMNFEHRFFVLDGEVLTGSPYLVDGVGYHPGIDRSRQSDAEVFLREVLDSQPDLMPPAFVVDVAMNESTGNWVVIEANRAWSSGLYGCDPTLALLAVDASSHHESARWQWVPDAHLVENVKTWDPIVVSDDSFEDSSSFFKFGS